MGMARRIARPKDGQPELQRGGQALGHDGERRLLEPDGLAEVAPDEVAEEHRVLHRQRPVQAQLLAQRGISRSAARRAAGEAGVGSPDSRMTTKTTVGDQPERDEGTTGARGQEEEERPHARPSPCPLPEIGERASETGIRPGGT